MTSPPSDEEITNQLRNYSLLYSHRKLVDVVGHAISDALEDVVQQRYNLGRPTEGSASISRLTGQIDQCEHNTDQESLSRANPPHHPIQATHTDLWLSRNEPAAYSLHLQNLGPEQLAKLLAFSRGHDLELRIDPTPFRDVFQTCHVMLIPSFSE
jgi:hypothetical protein